eukprot:GHVO01038112.1.p1 GENE.GHVO01038112.1~~GHVO01038112.1.p1  ORF type:complete len:218 (+),score=38.23 GHVO01038112.1:92-745(+)
MRSIQLLTLFFLLGVTLAAPVSNNDVDKTDTNLTELKEKLRNLNSMLGNLDRDLPVPKPADTESLNDSDPAKEHSDDGVHKDDDDVDLDVSQGQLLPEFSEEAKKLLQKMKYKQKYIEALFQEKEAPPSLTQNEVFNEQNVHDLQSAADQVVKEHQRKELQKTHSMPLPQQIDVEKFHEKVLEVEKYSSRILSDLAVAKKNGVTLQDLLKALNKKAE